MNDPRPVIIPLKDFAEYDAHRAPHLAAYRQAARNAERAYREAVAPVQRARDEAMWAAAAAYEAATGRSCPDPEWRVMA